MDVEELESKIEDMKEAKLILNNMKEGGEVGRFKFTEIEGFALDFVITMLDVFIQPSE